MVQNPIYEGPYYETLDAHAQLRTVNTQAAATNTTLLDHTTQTIAPEESANSTNSSPTLRYVKQPCVPQINSAHALISPSGGHSTSEQHHTFQFPEKGNGNNTVICFNFVSQIFMLENLCSIIFTHIKRVPYIHSMQ